MEWTVISVTNPHYCVVTLQDCCRSYKEKSAMRKQKLIKEEPKSANDQLLIKIGETRGDTN